MKNQRILLVALCTFWTMTRQENNTCRKQFTNLDLDDISLDSYENDPEVIEKYTWIYKNTQRSRFKRNLLKKFISRSQDNRQTRRHSGKLGIWSYPPAYGVLPNGAFSAGLDVFGKQIFIGRGYIPGVESLVPGRLQETDVCVEVSWIGWGRCLGTYEVLIGDEYTWKPGHRDWFPYTYVIAGNQSTTEEGVSELLVCRYYIRDENFTDQLVIGKVTQDGRCWVGYNGMQTIFYGVYEILTFKT